LKNGYRKKGGRLGDFEFWAAAAFVMLLLVYSRTGEVKMLLAAAVILAAAALPFAVKLTGRLRKTRKYLHSGINAADRMTGEQFEEFLLCHYKKLGYSGNTTAVTGDFGADLILKKDGEKIVVQAKRYEGNKVGVAAVQQIIAAKSYYKAGKGVVATNNYFTKNAAELAGKTGIELIDRDGLIEIMNKTQKDICPFCGRPLALRNGSNGNFYGCTGYPQCRYTRSI